MTEQASLARPDAVAPRLEAEIRPRDGRLIVSLRGELDLADVGFARETIAEAVAASGQVVIDLRALEFIDLAGAALILGFLRDDGLTVPKLWRSRHQAVNRVLAFVGAI